MMNSLAQEAEVLVPLEIYTFLAPIIVIYDVDFWVCLCLVLPSVIATSTK